ncbi:MAG: MotA/TolQ/ExbB proton channel family protein [Chitinispirillales bacterium]|jgi:biopolymer transport protein TolQ|nr:MotA/TolQ/ExbB proton channel family protein [Chitinispirillales bacterium]
MDIPVIDLILKSGTMGKAVCAILGIFSLWSWALIFARIVSLNRVSRSNRGFQQRFQQDVRHMTEIDRMSNTELNTPMGQLAKVGVDEYHRIMGDARALTKVKDWSFFLESQFTMAKERVESALAGIVAPFDRGVILLAMVSSIAPFLGLLGTVWGIMNAFYEIGRQGSASLPVVAPGIAESLITTIVGLAVAIPALFFYNYCNNKAERAADEMEELKDLLVVRLRREIFSAFFSEAPAPAKQPPFAAPPPIGGGPR